MPLLNFKKQFADDVITGRKKCTIRSLRKNPFKRGDHLYLYTGLRTKGCKKLGEAIASEVMPIEIIDIFTVVVDGKKLKPREILELAKKDGFKGEGYFMDFFSHTHELPFSGQIIKWGNINEQI